MTPEQAQALRAVFPDNAIGQLPKPLRKDAEKGRCNDCGGWHGLPAVHLDYVGHAAATDRLLSVDPEWTWEPFALGADGLPVLSRDGDLWIRLTVAGVTRPGVGDGASMKERIGDAIRNAAMRFGVALDLWAKEDLHAARGAEDDSTSAGKSTRGRRTKTPPETPPADGAPKTGPSEKQTKTVMAMFGELGLKERGARLERTSAIVGREVASWSDVTPDEADQVIDALRIVQRDQSGDVPPHPGDDA